MVARMARGLWLSCGKRNVGRLKIGLPRHHLWNTTKVKSRRWLTAMGRTLGRCIDIRNSVLGCSVVRRIWNIRIAVDGLKMWMSGINWGSFASIDTFGTIGTRRFTTTEGGVVVG